MAQPFDITAYAFQASLVCPACIVGLISGGEDTEPMPVPPGLTAEKGLALLAERLGVDRMDESSYDSDDFPKVVFRDQLGDAGDLPDEWTATDTAKRAACRIDTSGLPATCEVCGEVLGD